MSLFPKSQKLELEFNEKQVALIEELIDKGFHGTSAAQCVMRLIDAQLLEIIEEKGDQS
jgi:hypothetical protein